MIARGKGVRMQVCMLSSVKARPFCFLAEVEEKIWVDLFSCLKVEARYVGFSQMKNVAFGEAKMSNYQSGNRQSRYGASLLGPEATPLLLRIWCHLWVCGARALACLTGVVCK